MTKKKKIRVWNWYLIDPLIDKLSEISKAEGNSFSDNWAKERASQVIKVLNGQAGGDLDVCFSSYYKDGQPGEDKPSARLSKIIWDELRPVKVAERKATNQESGITEEDTFFYTNRPNLIIARRYSSRRKRAAMEDYIYSESPENPRFTKEKLVELGYKLL